MSVRMLYISCVKIRKLCLSRENFTKILCKFCKCLLLQFNVCGLFFNVYENGAKSAIMLYRGFLFPLLDTSCVLHLSMAYVRQNSLILFMI